MTDSRHKEVIATHQRLDDLRDQIFGLGLERHIVELELYGYTIVNGVKPLSFFEEIRETILKLGQEDREQGQRLPLAGPERESFLVRYLLARDRIFEEAVMEEHLLTLVTYLMGESCQISSVNGHVRAQGTRLRACTPTPLLCPSH